MTTYANQFRKTFRKDHGQLLEMPFGLTNALATFQDTMNTLFNPYLKMFVLVFFPNILVYNLKMEDHLQHLSMVVKIPRASSLFENESKCDFIKVDLVYLGHIISEGVKMDPNKIIEFR